MDDSVEPFTVPYRSGLEGLEKIGKLRGFLLLDDAILSGELLPKNYYGKFTLFFLSFVSILVDDFFSLDLRNGFRSTRFSSS